MLTYEQLIKTLKGASAVLLLATLGVAVFFTLDRIGMGQPEIEVVSTNEVRAQSGVIIEGPLAVGPLSLKSDKLAIPFPNLSEEIVLLGTNTRPDRHQDLSQILLGLKKSGDSQQAFEEETLFLNVETPEISFQEGSSPLWITPHQSDDGWRIKCGIHLGEDLSDEREFILKAQNGPSESYVFGDKVFEESLNTLNSLKVFGPDLLLTKYGGDRYDNLKKKPRFSFADGSRFFLFEGDALSFFDGEWHLTDLGAASREHPLMLVESVSITRVLCRVWDTKGFATREVSLNLQPSNSFGFSPEEIFGRIRARTLHSVSCRLAGKSAILREGDWILHAGGSWKILKSVAELEKLLEYHLKGELFVFDGVRKKQGESKFMGHFFDETRSAIIPVSIPLTEKKGKKPAAVQQADDEFGPYDPDLDDDFDEDWDFFDEVY